MIRGWRPGRHVTALGDLNNLRGALTHVLERHQVEWCGFTRTMTHRAILEDDRFAEIRIGLTERGGIPARSVTDCLGEPEIYRAIHDSHHHVLGGDLHFEMVFSSGVMATGTEFYRRVPTAPLSIDENFAIDIFVITSPGTVVDILQQAHSAQAQETFNFIHPWPENWADIQVDVTPEMQRILQMH